MAAHRRLLVSARRHADRRVLAGGQASGRRLGAGPGRSTLSRARLMRTGERTSNDLAAMIEKLPDLVNADAALVRRGRTLTVVVLIEIGATPYYVSIAAGRIARVERGPLLTRSWSFAIRGSEQAWGQFWLPVPPPHFHDLFALAKRGEFRIEGDFHPLMSNLLYLKDMLAAPRRLASEAH